jgi:hypothetical protein
MPGRRPRRYRSDSCARHLVDGPRPRWRLSCVKEAGLEMVKDQTDEIQMMIVMLDQRRGQVLSYPNP